MCVCVWHWKGPCARRYVRRDACGNVGMMSLSHTQTRQTSGLFHPSSEPRPSHLFPAQNGRQSTRQQGLQHGRRILIEQETTMHVQEFPPKRLFQFEYYFLLLVRSFYFPIYVVFYSIHLLQSAYCNRLTAAITTQRRIDVFLITRTTFSR